MEIFWSPVSARMTQGIMAGCPSGAGQTDFFGFFSLHLKSIQKGSEVA